MIAPLSAKQEREWAKHHAKESRETKKMENEESRKQELHELKLQEAAVKAGQGVAHKEELHGLKVKELGGPLSGKRMNREKMGLPSNNPLAGAEVFHKGQHMLPKGTDTVPAMLTPGEAVIPKAAAQDPKNKPLIQQMVQQGRQAQYHAQGTTGIVQQANMIPILPKVAPHRKVKGYAEGTESVPNPNNTYHTDSVATMEDGTTQVEPRYYDDGTEAVAQGVAPYGLRYQNDDPTVAPIDYSIPMPKGNGYMGNINQGINVPPVTEYTLDDNKGQYPSVVPTLSRDEVAQVANEQMTPEIAAKAAQYRDTRVANGESPFADRVGLKAPVAAADNLYKEGQPKPVPVQELSSTAVPKPNVYDTEDAAATPEARLDAASASSILRDKAHADVEQLDAQRKAGKIDDRTFVETFKDIFSYKGLKDALGLNNQEVARMAAMYLGSRARGYDGARSLSFAGRNAFETSLHRQDVEEKAAAQERLFEHQDARAMAIEKFKTGAAQQTAAFNAAKENQKEQFKVYSDTSNKLYEMAGYIPQSIKAQILPQYEKDVSAAKTLEEKFAVTQHYALQLSAYSNRKSDTHINMPKSGEWDKTYVDQAGRTVTARRNEDGTFTTLEGKRISGNSLFTKQTYDHNFKEVADRVQDIVEQDNKDQAVTNKNAKRVNSAEVGNMIALTGMRVVGNHGLSPEHMTKAGMATYKSMKESGADINPESFDKRFTTDAIVTLNPSMAAYFTPTNTSTKPKDINAARVDFGTAVTKLQQEGESVAETNDRLKKSYETLPLAAQKALNSTAIVRPGFNPYMEFAVAYSDPKSASGQKVAKELAKFGVDITKGK